MEGNRSPAVAPSQTFSSLEDAKAAPIPQGYNAWIEGLDGWHHHTGGQWVFQRGPAVIELTHKRMSTNQSRIEASVVGPQGEWSIEEAGRVMASGHARFTHSGQDVNDLNMLPELQK